MFCIIKCFVQSAVWFSSVRVFQGKRDAGDVRPSGWDTPQAKVNLLTPVIQYITWTQSQWSWISTVSVFSLLRDGRTLQDLETLLNSKGKTKSICLTLLLLKWVHAPVPQTAHSRRSTESTYYTRVIGHLITILHIEIRYINCSH